MTPKEFIEYRERLRKRIASLEEDIEDAHCAAMKCPIPANLRPATAADIVNGNVIWYPDKDEPYWCIVEEVRHPADDWKAYIWNGARYGLRGAFVEV